VIALIGALIGYYAWLAHQKSAYTFKVNLSDTKSVIYLHPSPDPISHDRLIRRSKIMHERRHAFLFKSPADYAPIENRCQQLSQHLQLLDDECTGLWLHKLRDAKIIGVNRFWGFENTHFGAITLNLEGNMKAMFKPCTSVEEDTTKEVIASYLDQLLKWGQTAPVITRSIPISIIRELVVPEDLSVFQKTIDRCSRGSSNLVGPMIGWWEGLIPIRTVKKARASQNKLAILRDDLQEFLLAAQMQSKYHTFYMLINILRHGKDEYITHTGDLVSLDLDRSRFRSTPILTAETTNFTWCYTCYMDRRTYDLLKAVGPDAPRDAKLSALMKIALSHEDIFMQLYDERMGIALDTRVRMLLACIDACILRYGESNVLLNEPNATPRKIVEYFVTHSDYSNQNGKQGPEDFEFLELLPD